jgi:diacylglycerol kinase (ATP)
MFVVFSLALLLIVELVNTAIEKANDAHKKTNDPLIKFSKDAASASVFLTMCLVGFSLLNLFLN